MSENLPAVIDQAADAARSITERARKMLATTAEVNERPAYYYLAICAPDCAAKAMRNLVRRKFGVFQAMQWNWLNRYAGHQSDGSHVDVSRLEQVFEDYLFVLVWDIDKMQDRILSCPGVDGLLLEFGEPVPIRESFIDQLRALSWIEDASAAGRHVAVSGRRQLKRRRRKSHKITSPQDRRAARLLSKEWENGNRLGTGERISLLLKAVSPPVVGPGASGNGG